MNNKINKNQVVLTILLIFCITFSLFIFTSYQDKKGDMEYLKTNIQKMIDNLYDEVTKTMLEKQLKSRAKFMLNKYKAEEKLIAFENQDRDKLKDLFSIHFENLKGQIKGFEIMHFYTPKGRSILRMHNPNKYGDDLTNFRPCVVSVVKNPRSCSFFEVGIQGLAYRHVTPVYSNNKLLGFFEIGIKPLILLNKINSVFGLNGYFFIKDQYIPKNMNKELTKLKNNGYTLCQFCSKKDQFIMDNISKINISNINNNEFTYENKTYNMLSHNIFDAKSNNIGSMVIFQDITLFKNQIDNLIIKSTVLFIISALLIFIILNRYVNKIFKKLTKARFLLDNTNDAVYVVSLKDGAILDVNERASFMLGFTKEELLNKKVKDIRKPINGDKPLNWNEHINKLKLNHFITSRGIHIRKDKTEFPVEASLSYIKEGNEEYMIAVARDITAQLQMENKIRKKANELERLQNVISKSVLYTTSDINGKILSVSKAFEKLSGYKEEELIGKNHSLFKYPDTPKEFYTNMWEVLKKDKQFTGEIKNITKENKEYWVKITIDPLFDENDKKIGYSSYRENITDKKELEYISTHDTLTGIYNRGYFMEEIKKKVKSAKRYDQKFGFIILDIDHFKNINDTYGHHEGDEVLKSIASCIDSHIRDDDMVARWGGEEFVIIANGADIKQLEGLVKKLQSEIKKVSFTPIPDVTASFGLTVYIDGDNCESIQKRADSALYKAKENGRNQYKIL